MTFRYARGLLGALFLLVAPAVAHAACPAVNTYPFQSGCTLPADQLNIELANASRLSTGVVSPSVLPAPTGTTLGGVKSLVAVSGSFLTGIDTSGNPTSESFADFVTGRTTASPLAGDLIALVRSGTTYKVSVTTLCGDIAAGAVLFSDGTGCVGDVARFFWDSTANPSASAHSLNLIGGNLSGWVQRIYSDYDPSRLPSGFLEFGYNLEGKFGQIQAIDETNGAAHLSLNGAGGTVSMGTDSLLAGSGAVLLLNQWTTNNFLLSTSFANSFKGGIYLNANQIDELRFYTGGPTLSATFSGDPTVNSFVPNRFTAAGLTDNTLSNCVVDANVSGNLGCSTTVGSLNTDNTWTGTNTFGPVIGKVTDQSGTTYILAATDCGTMVRFTNAAAVAVTVPNSLPAGCNIAFMQMTAGGQITVSAGAGATFNANPHGYTKSFGQNAIFGIAVDSNSGGSAATFTTVGDGA